MTEHQAAEQARALVDGAKFCQHLAEKRAERAQTKMQELKKRQSLVPASADRSVDEWAALGMVARRVAAKRERDSLLAFFTAHAWRLEDISFVLDSLWWAKKLFKLEAAAVLGDVVRGAADARQ
eukprot:7195122-Prymnesium_polylepis.1